MQVVGVQNAQLWTADCSRDECPLTRHNGGYARGLSLVAVTVREDVCWAGAGRSGVARGALVYEKYMEGSSGVDGGCMGPAMPVVCLSIPGAREDTAGGSPHCRSRYW